MPYVHVPVYVYAYEHEYMCMYHVYMYRCMYAYVYTSAKNDMCLKMYCYYSTVYILWGSSLVTLLPEEEEAAYEELVYASNRHEADTSTGNVEPSLLKSDPDRKLVACVVP